MRGSRGRGRPKGPRWVAGTPSIDVFKPRGTPLSELESVHLSVNELEALRLVDLMELDQEGAATRMGVSRKTLWSDLKSGRRKVVDALTTGKMIVIESVHPRSL
ncbi:MAG: DUF134 domain-containing protein, partial [Methermicoccaceae archaeon]